MNDPSARLKKLFEKKFFLFLLLSFALYGNTLRNGYAIDDQFVTENHYSTQGLSAFRKILTSYYADDGKNSYEYRPVASMSFAIEHQLFGVHPWMGHLINVLLYACCLLLLYKVLLRVLHTQPQALSLAATLVFACLPVHTEVVASLKNRDVLLCFIFCMGVLIQADFFLSTRRYRYLAFCVLLVMAGFLTKYDLLPYLAITPLLLYKKYGNRQAIFPLLLVFIVFIAGFYLSKGVKLAFLDKSTGERIYNYSENPLFFTHSLASRIPAAFNCLGFYAKMMVFPSRMVCYYGYNTLPMSNLFSAYSVTGMLLAAIMLFYFFRLLKRDDPYWQAIVFSGISLSMYLNLVRPVTGIVAERFAFFASIGFAIFVAHLVLYVLNRRKKSLLSGLSMTEKAIFAAVFAICLVVTVSRNAEWKNRITLYEHDVKKRPESVPLHLLYSMEILSNINRPNYFMTDENRMTYVAKAASSLETLLKTDSANVTALHNLGFIRQNVYQDYAGAIPFYEKALQSDSTKFESRFNLAYCYYNAGRGADAERLAMSLLPEHADYQPLLDLLNYILITNQKSHEGIALFESLYKTYPANHTIPIILGNFHLALSDTAGAKTAYRIALKNDPSNDQLAEIMDKLSKK